jgi:hypothetical protein
MHNLRTQCCLIERSAITFGTSYWASFHRIDDLDSLIQAESRMDQGQHPTYFGLRQTDILDKFLRRFKEREAIGRIVKTITIRTAARIRPNLECPLQLWVEASKALDQFILKSNIKVHGDRPAWDLVQHGSNSRYMNRGSNPYLIDHSYNADVHNCVQDRTTRGHIAKSKIQRKINIKLYLVWIEDEHCRGRFSNKRKCLQGKQPNDDNINSHIEIENEELNWEDLDELNNGIWAQV